jgi:dipeptidase D
LGNANKLLNRLLYHTLVTIGAKLHKFDGGGLRNAIPRESEAVITVPKERIREFKQEFNTLKNQITKEYNALEPHINLSIMETDVPAYVMDDNSFTRLTKALYAAHNGVYRMSPDIPDLVETSNNIARVLTENKSFQ